MRRTRIVSLPVALAALFACTGPLEWRAACGCADVWTGVVGDVGVYWGDLKSEDVTPEFLSAKTLDRVKGQRLSLETVRGIGPLFDSSCMAVLLETRCIFWLWTNENDIRGVELYFTADEDGNISEVEGRYVYDKRFRKSG